MTAPVLSDGTADFTPSGEKRGSVKTTYHSALKNSDIQTDSSGAVSASVQFDAFGNVLSGSGTWKGQFGYAGKFGYQQDPDTGLKLLGHRYYDSDTGRFLTRDPAKDGRNWYSYCRNNPVSRTDPTGLKPGDKFATMDEAAMDAGFCFGQESIDNGREYGGLIYQNEDGTFSYSVAASIYRSHMTLGGFSKRNARGSWHTHPFLQGVTLPDRKGYEANNPVFPSRWPGDLMVWFIMNEDYNVEGPHYIVTASGAVIAWDTPDNRRQMETGGRLIGVWKVGPFLWDLDPYHNGWDPTIIAPPLPVLPPRGIIL